MDPPAIQSSQQLTNSATVERVNREVNARPVTGVSMLRLVWIADEPIKSRSKELHGLVTGG